MMIDARATCTCIQAKYTNHLPLSGQFVKTIGFSGKVALTPMTAPVPVTIGDRTTHIPILVCNKTLLNLLGGDAISGLGFRLECTNQGIHLAGIFTGGGGVQKVGIYPIQMDIFMKIWHSQQ